MFENPTAIVISFIAIVAAIILGYYGYKAVKSYLSPAAKIPWPPVYSPCPDYWTDLGSGDCKNVNLLGVCNNTTATSTLNFNDVGDLKTVRGREALCGKAKDCKITWEGIDTLC